MKLSQGIVAGLTKKAGFTVETAVANGFVAQDRVVNNFMTELEAVIPTSPAAMKAIEDASTMTDAIDAVKKQSLTALTNKAVTNLREKLEAKAVGLCAIVKADGIVQYHGIIGYTDVELVDEAHMHINQTYSYSLFAEIVLGHISPVAALNADIRVARQVLNDVLKNEAIMDVVSEFDENFCSGLAQGEYALGFGTKYYNFTAEEGLEHQEALFATLKGAGLVEAYENALNDILASMVANQQETNEDEVVEMTKETPVVEEVVATVTAEETVTITVAEYESLKTFETMNDTNLELMSQLKTRVEEYETVIEGLGKQLDEKDARIKELNRKLLAKTFMAGNKKPTNTKEEENMSTFKISVKSFKEVAVHTTPENKVVSSSAIEGMDVGNAIKARVKMVDVSKGLNQKVREKSPEVIVKAANATHTGIDAVATAAHKVTNVVAKSTNTAIQRSANAVDTVLDFIAPVEATVDMAAYRRTKAEAKDGDIVEIHGHKYEMKNGRLIVL